MEDMNKTLKENGGCIVPLFLMFLGCIFVFFGNGNCSNSKEEKPKRNIGKYMYYDRSSTLHAWRYCPSIGSGSTDEVDESRQSAVYRIPVEGVTMSMLDQSCAFCISDEIYDELTRKLTRK